MPNMKSLSLMVQKLFLTYSPCPYGRMRPFSITRQPFLSLAAFSASRHDSHPMTSSSLSFSTVRLQVFLGLPRFLPLLGAQVSARFRLSSASLRSTWPIRFHLLLLTVRERGVVLALSYSCSFEISSGQ